MAAPQIGVLKRIVVMDTEWQSACIDTNPQILEVSGETEQAMRDVSEHSGKERYCNKT